MPERTFAKRMATELLARDGGFPASTMDGAGHADVQACTLRLPRQLATSLWLALRAARGVQIGSPADLVGVAQSRSSFAMDGGVRSRRSFSGVVRQWAPCGCCSSGPARTDP